MQTTNRLFDDLAKVANGAVSTAVGVKEEIETLVRLKLEKFLANADLVPREEFEAVKAIATEARSEQILLAQRLAVLEKANSQARRGTAKKKSSVKSRTTRKPKQ